MELMAAAGYDRWYGRRLPELLTRAGLTDVHAEGHVLLLRGGSPDLDWFRVSIERLRDALLSAGWYTADAIDEVLALLDDPAFAFFAPVMVSAWGRRPH